MPCKFKFQHRKKQERQLRIARLATKLPVVNSTSEQTSVDSEISLLMNLTVTSSPSLTLPFHTEHSITSDEVPPSTQANELPTTPQDVLPTTLHIVHSSLALPSRFWSDHSRADVLDEIVLCKVSCNTKPLTVTHSLTINSDLSYGRSS